MNGYLTCRVMNAATKLYTLTTEVHRGDYTSQDTIYGWCETCETKTWSVPDDNGVYKCEGCGK